MNEKILVIDDEHLILTTIERALSKVGYTVRGTSNVKDFLDALSTGIHDLLIMDLHLGGVDNKELMRKVKEITPRLKILIISGSVIGLAEKYFLQKPFRIDELRQKVREILDEP